jgi:hypothetical protein
MGHADTGLERLSLSPDAIKIEPGSEEQMMGWGLIMTVTANMTMMAGLVVCFSLPLTPEY